MISRLTVNALAAATDFESMEFVLELDPPFVYFELTDEVVDLAPDTF